MGRYSAGFSVAGVNTANTTAALLNNTAGAQRVKVRQIAIGVATAPTTAPSFYLARSTARGTQGAALTPLLFDLADAASGCTVDTGHTVAPTFTNTAQFVRGGLAVTAGGWWVWDFRDDPIVIPATTAAGLLVANANASGATLGVFTGHFVWDE